PLLSRPRRDAGSRGHLSGRRTQLDGVRMKVANTVISYPAHRFVFFTPEEFAVKYRPLLDLIVACEPRLPSGSYYFAVGTSGQGISTNAVYSVMHDYWSNWDALLAELGHPEEQEQFGDLIVCWKETICEHEERDLKAIPEMPPEVIALKTASIIRHELDHVVNRGRSQRNGDEWLKCELHAFVVERQFLISA